MKDIILDSVSEVLLIFGSVHLGLVFIGQGSSESIQTSYLWGITAIIISVILKHRKKILKNLSNNN